MGMRRFCIYGVLLLLMMVMGMLVVQASAAEDTISGSDAVVATGDHFVLTQGEVDAYKEYLKSVRFPVSSNRGEMIRSVIKCELFADAFRKANETAESFDGPMEEQKRIGIKVRLTQQYIQKILDEYKIPENVFLSYYRVHPEKYAWQPLEDIIKMKSDL